MATPLILKRAPVGDNQDDYSVLETARSSVGFSRCRLRRRVAPGCGRAATTATYAARPTATSRRARRRWRRSQRELARRELGEGAGRADA